MDARAPIPSPLEPLAAAALLGTSRRPPAWPQIPGAIGELLTQLDATDPDARLLRTAGVLDLALEAGQEPTPAGPTFPEAPPEELPVVFSPALQAALGQILAGNQTEILIEYLDLLATRRHRVPDTYLPFLLGASTQQPALRRAIGRLPGQRHRWLASLNPEWQRVLAETADSSGELLPESLLETGTLAERIAVLRQIRRTNPNRARELLTPLLPKEAARERQELLSTVTETPHPTDEPFLESVLADKARGIRRLAAATLSRLPQSAFALRLQARLAPLVEVRKRLLRSPTLEFTPPAEFDPAWSRDAIEEKPPVGEGPRAAWLRQLVGFTPLAWWQAHTGLAPDALLQAIAPSEWNLPLVLGLVEAATQQRDAAWATALVELASRPELTFDRAELASIAGPACVEAWILRIAQNDIAEALEHAARIDSWSVPLASRLLRGLRAACKTEPDYRILAVLPTVALRLPVSLLATAAADWGELPEQPYYRSPLDSFLTRLQLRKAIHEES